MNPGGINVGQQQILELRDVHLPPAPGWWPPAPGWWLAGALLLTLLIATGIRLRKRIRQRRRKRKILSQLSDLGASYVPEQASEFLSGVSVLLRRVAVDRFPRQDVASLSGEAWLQFLDSTGGEGRFQGEVGHVLGEGPYQARAQADPDPVLSLAREWIVKNLVREE